MTEVIKVAVVQAGLSTPSSTGALADALQSALVTAVQELTPRRADVARVNLRDYAVKVAQATVSGVRSDDLEQAISSVADADVVIAVTPTFNASYAGIFKSFFDLIGPRGLDGAVAILGATGGTERHSLVIDLAMRPLFAYLRAIAVPTSVFAASEDFGSADSSISQRARTVAREALSLLGYAGAGNSVIAFDAERDGASSESRESDDGENKTDAQTPSASGVRAHSRPGRSLAAREVGIESAEILESVAGDFVPFSEIARGLGK